MSPREKTLYNINKLIKQYKKRSQKCSEEYNKIEKNNFNLLREDFKQSEMLLNEEMLLDEFISDLENIKEEIENA